MRARLVGVIASAMVAVLGVLVLSRHDEGTPRADEAHVAEVAIADRPRTARAAVPSAGDDAHVRMKGVLEGFVVESGGLPAGGACVRFGRLQLLSDDHGRFRFPELPVAEVVNGVSLFASKAGHGTARARFTSLPARPVRLVLSPAAAIVGTVVDANGPVVDASVLLHDEQWQRLLRTGADGRFAFEEARTEACRLVVAAAGRVPRAVDVWPDTARREVMIWLESTPEIPLRVVDHASAPVVGARVLADWHWKSPELRMEGVSDERGVALSVPASFVPPRVRVEAEGFGSRAYSINSTVRSELVIQLKPEVSLRILVADRTAAPTASRWWFALGANYAGLDSASLATAAGPAASAPVRIGEIVESAVDGWVSADDGMAVIRGASAGGSYSVVGVRRDALGREESPRFVVWLTRCLPHDPPPIQWPTPRLVALHLRTIDAASDAGVSAMVTADPEAGSVHSTDERARAPTMHGRAVVATSDEGVAQLMVPSGEYVISATRGSTRSELRKVIVSDVSAPVCIETKSAVGVRGRLRTHASPLSGRQVMFESTTEPRAYIGMTDEAGKFEIVDLPTGSYLAYFDGARGEKLANGPVAVTAPSADLDFVVGECALRGCVSPAPNGPTVVAARPADDRGSPWVVMHLDEQGRFRLTGISRGLWELQVRRVKDDSILHAGVAEVSDDAVVDIRIE